MEAPRLNTSQSEGALSGTSRMSAQRREKLMNIKMREELKDALTTKFRDRFGHAGPHKQPDEMSVASTNIRREVGKFARLADLSEANLGRLERRIQSRAQGKVKGDDVTSIAGVSVYSGGSVRSRSSVSLAGKNLVGSNPLEGLPPMDWTKLDEYAGYVHEQDSLRQQHGVKSLQKKMRMDLEQQIEAKKQKKLEIIEEDARHHQNSLLELERWKKMEELREGEKKAKLMKEKADRDAQLNYDRAVRAEAEKVKAQEEADLVEKIVLEMRLEQEKFEAKKKEAKEHMMKVFHDNQEDIKKRAEADAVQREKDAAALEEYARAQAEEEGRREAELKERMDRQNALMSKLMGSVEDIKKGAGNDDHKRALAQQEEMDRHFFQAEQIKQERLKQMRLENQQYLLRQIEEKQHRKDDENFLHAIQSQIMEKDTAEYEEMERRKQITRKLQNHEHKKDIEKQMEYKLAQSVPLMSENEMKMNAPLLQLVHKTLTNKAEKPPPAVDPEDEDL